MRSLNSNSNLLGATHDYRGEGKNIEALEQGHDTSSYSEVFK